VAQLEGAIRIAPEKNALYRHRRWPSFGQSLHQALVHVGQPRAEVPRRLGGKSGMLDMLDPPAIRPHCAKPSFMASWVNSDDYQAAILRAIAAPALTRGAWPMAKRPSQQRRDHVGRAPVKYGSRAVSRGISAFALRSGEVEFALARFELGGEVRKDQDMKPSEPAQPIVPVNAEYVERCQLEYARNPQSRIFAPLAEAYRKLGLLGEALRACESGLQYHPDFAGGRVVYAKCLLDRAAFAEALAQLEKAAEASPDNLLAHSLMAETLLQLRRPKDALRAFKMTLFLNPQDERARQAVRKWEFLTADEYDADLFVMDSIGAAAGLSAANAPQPQAEGAPGLVPPLKAGEASDRIAQAPPAMPPPALERELERSLSLADAFTVRNNLDSAMQVLRTARERLGPLPEIENRLALLLRRAQVLEDEAPQPIRPLGSRPADTVAVGERRSGNGAAGEFSPGQGFDGSMAPKAPTKPPPGAGPAASGRKAALLKSLLQRIRERRAGT
jgi:tetratricopeptide (TPR) repeat protein